jgi:thiamine-monophosphate kinase
MKLSELGEFAFIGRFAPEFMQDLGVDILGIGDDCAVLPIDDQKVMLITTDMLIEDSHFLLGKIPPADLGYKSLAVNLSDIAAMGGNPRYAFLSLGLPHNTEVEWMDDFFSGLHDLCRETNVLLLGGDTTRSGKHLIINIALIGEALKDRVKYRSTAREGDIICVTGYLGDSGCGLRLVLESKPTGNTENLLIKRHYRPRAHLEEGSWLGAQPGIHGMMDVSDGIDSDLKRIMEKSECGVEIDLQLLPTSREFKKVCARYQWDCAELAATGGEDYCLLCTTDPQSFPGINRGFKEKFGRELYRIGKIKSGNQFEYLDQGRRIRLSGHGFDHFI